MGSICFPKIRVTASLDGCFRGSSYPLPSLLDDDQSLYLSMREWSQRSYFGLRSLAMKWSTHDASESCVSSAALSPRLSSPFLYLPVRTVAAIHVAVWQGKDQGGTHQHRQDTSSRGILLSNSPSTRRSPSCQVPWPRSATISSPT